MPHTRFYGYLTTKLLKFQRGREMRWVATLCKLMQAMTGGIVGGLARVYLTFAWGIPFILFGYHIATNIQENRLHHLFLFLFCQKWRLLLKDLNPVRICIERGLVWGPSKSKFADSSCKKSGIQIGNWRRKDLSFWGSLNRITNESAKCPGFLKSSLRLQFPSLNTAPGPHDPRPDSPFSSRTCAGNAAHTFR